MNKKFLKSVAALFAVAVLGISCSNNNTDPNKKEEGAEGTQKPTITASLTQTTDASKENTTLKLQIDSAGTGLHSSANKVQIAVTTSKPAGNAIKLENVEIISVKGIKEKVVFGGSTPGNGKTFVDLSSVKFNNTDVDLTGTTTSQVHFTVKSPKISQLNAVFSSSANTKAGVLEVKFRIKDGKEFSNTLTAYIHIIHE